MHRLLACVGLVLAMVIAMDRTLSAGLGELLLTSNDRFMGIYRPSTETAADVLVIGNSRADNHFPQDTVAAATCGRALNLGMGGAPTVISEVLWEDYVERHGTPRLLIVEPTSVVDDPHSLSDAPMLSYWSPRMDELLRRTDETLWASNQLFHTLIFNSNQTIRTAMGMLRPEATDRTLTGTISAQHRAQIEALPKEEWHGHQANLEALDRIIASARAKGVEVAVVITPLYGPFLAKVTNVEQHLAELKGRLPKDIRVIDLHDAVTGDDHFVDPLHVNREGVNLMLASLTEKLGNSGVACPTEMLADLNRVK